MSEAKAPPLSLWLRELPYTAPIIVSPLRRVKAIDRMWGEDQPVLVFPGILSSDQSTSLLRRTFDEAGFRAHPSKLGFLTGIKQDCFTRAKNQLEAVCESEGRAPILLGWSLGGLYARVLAQRHPENAAMVITMGTPFSGDRRANNAWRLYEAINDHSVDAPPLPDNPSTKPPVHTVAVWSRNDGVIAPECARGQEGERDVAVEVPFRHFALGSSRRAINAMIEIAGDQMKAVC